MAYTYLSMFIENYHYAFLIRHLLLTVLSDIDSWPLEQYLLAIIWRWTKIPVPIFIKK